jgi:Beta-lactamase/Tetratricopeptide repeat
VPGVVALITDRRGVIYQGAFGVADVSTGRPVAADSLFRIASTTKAVRAALLERTRERVPLRWAITQNNLGVALRILGGWERDTARLEEAVAAHRAALEENTRERAGLYRASTQIATEEAG